MGGGVRLGQSINIFLSTCNFNFLLTMSLIAVFTSIVDSTDNFFFCFVILGDPYNSATTTKGITAGVESMA